MKRVITCLVAGMMLLGLCSPVLAASMGVSPSSIEIDVPVNGSTKATFYVSSDFDGELQISLEDIPLEIEPETVPLKSGETAEFDLTFYGDESLGLQTFTGKIRFIGMSGGMVAPGIKVKAKITQVGAVQLPPEETPPEQVPAPQGGIEGLPLTTVIIIAGGLVFLGLIVLSITLARRRRY